MQQIVENHTHKSGNYHEKGTLKNGTTPYHRQVKLPPGPRRLQETRQKRQFLICQSKDHLIV